MSEMAAVMVLRLVFVAPTAALALVIAAANFPLVPLVPLVPVVAGVLAREVGGAMRAVDCGRVGPVLARPVAGVVISPPHCATRPAYLISPPNRKRPRRG